MNVKQLQDLRDNYAVSGRQLESQRTETLQKLYGFHEALGYLGGKMKNKGKN
jgi:hypothetical protein